MSLQPLRVLHVLGELKPSGAETMLVAAAPLFHAHGVEAEVLSTGASEGPFAERFRAAGYTVRHLPFGRSPAFFLRERQLMAAGKYDVIHLHGEKANFWHGLVAWSVRPAVLLRTVHNVFPFTGNLQWRRGWQRRTLHRLGVQHVAISDSVQRTEARHYRLPTTLIWNWYDSARFTATSEAERTAARQALDIAPDDFVIASIGNCSRVKNHTALIQALARIPAAKRPLYLHAGLEEEHQPERDLARSLGLETRIRFIGGASDVLTLLRAADAYVMPSLYEGFGISAIEALATGLPAVFTDVPGLRDFKSDFPGLIYTGTSSEALAHGIEALMQIEPSERAQMARLYPQMTRRRFGMERGVEEYLAIYRRAAGSTRNDYPLLEVDEA
mgnify:CR=1 FL=1